jgi:hypothetical protein
MGWTTGTASRIGVPLHFRFRYNGADIAWPQPYRINEFKNSGESVDGKFRISDLDVSFVDVNGSYFATQFGRGTLGFGSSLQVIAYLGGTSEFQTSSAGVTSPHWLGSVGANVATIHTGNIYNISFSDRVLRIRSKNKMAVLNSLKLQFPVHDLQLQADYWVGSLAFVAGLALQDLSFGTGAFYDYEDAKTRWKTVAYCLGSSFGTSGYISNAAAFPQMSGRGTGTCESHFVWAGTDSNGSNFYDTYEPAVYDGTYFGTLTGTISSDESAHFYGYVDKDSADSHKTDATTYPINKTRISKNGSQAGSYFHFSGFFNVVGNPREVLETMLTGAMVNPLFNSSDLDTTTFGESGTILTYSAWDQRFHPAKHDEPLEIIKSIFETTQALFSVNSSNKFEFRAYGPKNLTQSIPAFGTSSIISSEFENDESDFYNRFIIKYKYDGTQQYGSLIEVKSSSWDRAYDRPLSIQSKWITNDNEANIYAGRLKQRYERTFPHITVKTNLSKLGHEIGTLLTITDPNSGISSKVVQVVGFTKNFEQKEIEFNCWDGEALWQRRGYAFWNGSTMSVPGNETSNAIWGPISGTMNTTIYGSQFSWW